MKIATNIHHMGGHCGNIFKVRGQRSRSWQTLCDNGRGEHFNGV